MLQTEEKSQEEMWTRRRPKRTFVLHAYGLPLRRIVICTLIVLGLWYVLRPYFRIKRSPLGLRAHDKTLYLDGEPFKLLSGEVHYFRVVPEYWKHSLLMVKAAGLNTVSTYVPWNLHEEIKGKFNFKDGLLDIVQYLELAQEVGLYVVLRPGPYICGEWEFGGMPSWLLNDPSMKVRSTYPPFLKAVDNYFSELIPLVAGLQYSRGGPIIAFQIENEYGAYEQDKKYLEALKDSLLKYGVEELMLTADPAEHLEKGSLPGVLPTATFNTISRGDLAFKNIAALSPEWPLVTMEFWPGWYDVWGSKHNTMKDEEMEAVLSFILKSGSSVNFYMFHGGTNFGFMNGAYYPSYVATVTSYDYDAPVNEQGEANTKFTKIIETLFKNVPESVSSTLPPIPPARPVEKYGTLEIEKYLLLDDMVKRMKAIYGIEAVPMEFLGQVNNGGGQGYGFILYRTEITKGGKLKFSDTVRDRAVVLLNGTEIATFNLNKKDMVVAIKGPNKPQNKTTYVLDVLVENMGRLNSMGYYNGTKVPFESQRKGITSTVYLDKAVLIDWDHYPLEFRKPFLTSMLSSGDWSPYKDVVGTPGMFYTRLTVTKHPPCDTFIDMKGWKKGVVFVNGFNLGRYWEIGPQRTLYLPGPLLRTGNNEILIFELHGSKPTITFKDKPQLDL